MTKPDLSPADSPLARKFRSIYQLYLAKRSLAGVGKELGLSRERIRQLLEEGNRLGLFKYRRLNRNPQFRVPKDKIIKDFQKVLHLNKVADLNHITGFQLKRLLAAYHITRKALTAIRLKARKEKCRIEYHAVMNELGHQPSAMELRKSEGGQKLYSKIIRLWHSYHKFRLESKFA